jgi:50S ribosomal protein L16 3-hydroxylase
VNLFRSNKSKQHFLQHYWQRSPIVLPQALPAFEDPLSPEELAGLACNEDTDSRIVHTLISGNSIVKRNKRPSAHNLLSHDTTYQLSQGPFRESDFTSLPTTHWTLLVQAVDHFLPALKCLQAAIDFLPSWRFDDVMVSYATPGGGVGPHFDHYDVFLVQGMGTRKWHIGQHCSEQDFLDNKSGLKLLPPYKPHQTLTLKTGDVLYVPPGFAHWGISDDNSMSYSIGMRAPSANELLISYFDHLLEQNSVSSASGSKRYKDKKKHLVSGCELTIESIKEAWNLLKEHLNNQDTFTMSLAKFLTLPRHEELIQPRRRLTESLIKAEKYQLDPSSRMTWFLDSSKMIQLFVNGQCISEKVPLRNAKTVTNLLNQLGSPSSTVKNSTFKLSKELERLKLELLRQGALNPKMQ